MTIKAVLLIGGPSKGQRFRPLSLDSPKYAFPIGGKPIIAHLIESCLQLEELSEIILLGFYEPDESLSLKNLNSYVQTFLTKQKLSKQDESSILQTDRKISIRYLQEFSRMGTAGGLYHYRDEIRRGNPEAVMVINGDVCGDFDFDLMLNHHRKLTILASKTDNLKPPYITVMATEASRIESLSYGCLVEDADSHAIKHYVEKPSTFVSNLISCGAYICHPKIFELLEQAKARKNQDALDYHKLINGQSPAFHFHPDYLSLELDILQQRVSQQYCYVYRTQGDWWCQIKTAASAIYANRHCLRLCKTESNNDPALHGDNKNNSGDDKPKRSIACTILGDVYIHPSSTVDPSAVIGPNVSIMENAIIGPGVRVKESIVLQNAMICGHTLVMYSIVGWNCHIGHWVRVEGTPSEPNPNQRYAKVQNPPLFNIDGKLNPSITVLGCNVKIPSGMVIINSIVLPHKELARSYKNEIIL